MNQQSKVQNNNFLSAIMNTLVLALFIMIFACCLCLFGHQKDPGNMVRVFVFGLGIVLLSLQFLSSLLNVKAVVRQNWAINNTTPQRVLLKIEKPKPNAWGIVPTTSHSLRGMTPTHIICTAQLYEPGELGRLLYTTDIEILIDSKQIEDWSGKEALVWVDPKNNKPCVIKVENKTFFL